MPIFYPVTSYSYSYEYSTVGLLFSYVIGHTHTHSTQYTVPCMYDVRALEFKDNRIAWVQQSFVGLLSGCDCMSAS